MAGAASGSVEHHLLRIFATREWIDHPSPLPASTPGGYNHSWMLDKPPRSLGRAATLSDPASRRRLIIETTEPSLHAYTGEYFDGEDVSASGVKVRPRGGTALETQHLSDSTNKLTFPSIELRPGETYRSTTIWRFDIQH